MAYQCLVKKFSSCARTKMLYNISQKCANSKQKVIKLIYSEKATIFCEISTIDLSHVLTVKSTVEILQNFVAYSEYMNFIIVIYDTISQISCEISGDPSEIMSTHIVSWSRQILGRFS